jgi:hypothetical protein
MHVCGRVKKHAQCKSVVLSPDGLVTTMNMDLSCLSYMFEIYSLLFKYKMF